MQRNDEIDENHLHRSKKYFEFHLVLFCFEHQKSYRNPKTRGFFKFFIYNKNIFVGYTGKIGGKKKELTCIFSSETLKHGEVEKDKHKPNLFVFLITSRRSIISFSSFKKISNIIHEKLSFFRIKFLRCDRRR